MFSQSFGSFHNSKQISCFPRFLSLKLCLGHIWQPGIASAVGLGGGIMDWLGLCDWSGRPAVWRSGSFVEGALLAPSACLVKRCITISEDSILFGGEEWLRYRQFLRYIVMSHSICADCAAHCFTGSTWCCSRILSEKQTICRCKDILTTARSDSDSPYFWIFLVSFGSSLPCWAKA